ncbi:unnamed protein product [Closterium sp. NIES-64]|nr:unnamed protein product [Closterium sp. NIES-64]
MNELVIAGMNFTCVLAAVAEYQMPEKECLLNLLAKALGYGIILGSTILKLPQILVIIRSNSIEGLSVPSFEIECIGYTVSVGYCLFKKVPFTAYGELFFLLLQSLILMFLIYSHLPNQAATTWIKVGIYSAMVPVLFSGAMSAHLYETIYNAQTALFTMGRIPQMWSNYASKSTGQLSVFTTFLTFAGCIARLFTSIQEKAPLSMAIGSILGVLSHGTIFAQIVYYTYIRKGKASVTAATKRSTGKKNEKFKGMESKAKAGKDKSS